MEILLWNQPDYEYQSDFAESYANLHSTLQQLAEYCISQEDQTNLLELIREMFSSIDFIPLFLHIRSIFCHYPDIVKGYLIKLYTYMQQEHARGHRLQKDDLNIVKYWILIEVIRDAAQDEPRMGEQTPTKLTLKALSEVTGSITTTKYIEA